jgi:hypothetical protein
MAPPDTAIDTPAAAFTRGRGFTVADVARRYRVGEDKVRAWIRRGELVGVNVAANLSGKPQWRITPESVERFERRRSSEPPPKPPRRRRQTNVIDYYPGD